ncbi:hypothetical protein M422DRAFT_238692 [Sphaerobolus stellatus SS14]|nr:hypothetical protein M422DRAFT_238692 [Sphaerobolus stellatus SS14]
MANNDQPQRLLAIVLTAAGILSGSESKTQSSPNVATVLKTRLERVHEVLGTPVEDLGGADLKTIQFVTAEESLGLVEAIQDVLDPESSESAEVPSEPSSNPPLLGTRDLSYVRTLLSVVFKWALDPLVSELELTRPGIQTTRVTGQPRIIDLTERSIDYTKLPSVLLRVLRLVFGSEQPPRIRQSWITSSLLSRHAVDVLMPCLIVGWPQKPLLEDWAESAKEIKALSIRFINILRPNEAIAALGTILAQIGPKRRTFPYVAKICGFLLSKQLNRPEGVRGLCTAVFGEGGTESESAPLDKLEHIAKVLSTVPAFTSPEDYFRTMIPRIVALLLPSSTDKTPPTHKQAAAFALSRILAPNFQHHAIAAGILLPLLHDPFLKSPPITEQPSNTSDGAPSRLSPVETLKTLETFLLHADPSPTELSTLLNPIAPELYTLLGMYRSSKTADPSVREPLSALLSTWGRVVASSNVIAAVWKIVCGDGGNWDISLDGFVRSTRPPVQPSISLVTVASLEGKSKDDIDINSNPFNLRPDPSQFVVFLKGLHRQDVSSEIFVRLLDGYEELKSSAGEEPMRTLLYLQLVLQMQTQLSSSVLSQPEHVLSFVKHALDAAPKSAPLQKPSQPLKRGLGLEDLRIVEQVEEDAAGDSDDEDEDLMDLDSVAEGGITGGGKDEMVVTAVTLLLSILEGHPNITSATAPILNDILNSLGSITVGEASPTVRQLAREARLVLTARTASASAAARSRTAPKPESAQAIYQKALKLLQDPIIPVRAHGLQLLRDLLSRPTKVRSRSLKSMELDDEETETLDVALLPGILSIFLQSIQDEESYIFLNAVQGLAAMVDGYGKEVLRSLMDTYLVGTGVGGSGVTTGGGGAMKKEEMDTRVKVGEAISVVVKKCGDALGVYVDVLIPPLLTIIRSSHLPTTLRSSALSILAQCAQTNVQALGQYASNLADTCVELVKLESVPVKQEESKAKVKQAAQDESKNKDQGKQSDQEGTLPEALASSSAGSSQTESKPPTFPFSKPAAQSRAPEETDMDPTTTQAKAASLRRSALHLFSILIRAGIEVVYEAQSRAQIQTQSAQVQIPLLDESGGIRFIPGQAQFGRRISLFPGTLTRRAKIVLGYVGVTDEDGVVRVMAQEAGVLVSQYEQAVLGI